MQAEISIAEHDSTQGRGLNWIAQNWLLVLACIPVIRIMLLTSLDAEFASWQFASRIFWIPSLVVEMLIFVVAVLNGLNISQLINKLPVIAKILLSSWFLALLGSTFLADVAPIVAYRGAAFWFVHLLFLAAAAHLIRITGITGAPRLELFVLVLSGISAFAGLCLFLLVMIIGINSGFEWNLHLPGYANLRHTGYFFGPAIAVGIAYLAIRPSRFTLVHIALLAANTAFALWLGSRGPVFAIAVGLAVGTLFFAKMRDLLFWKRTMIGLGVGTFLSLVLPIPQNSHFGAIQRFWAVDVDSGRFSSGRIEFWMEAISLIEKKPFFGYGAHQYQFVSELAGGTYKHPHNSIVQFVFDWGFIGGALFILLLAYTAFMAFFRSNSSTDIKLLSAMGLTTIFAYSLVDGVLFYSYPIALFIVLLLLPIFDRRNENDSSAV